RALKAWGMDPARVPRERWGAPDVFDIRDPEGREIALEELPLVRVLRTGQPTSYEEYLLRRADGTMQPIEACSAPVHDADGRLVGGAVVVRDLSERKELE